MSDVADRLAALEARVAALEAAGGPDASVSASDPHPPTGGAVGYSGEVHLAGDVSWSMTYSPDGVRASAPQATSAAIASNR